MASSATSSLDRRLRARQLYRFYEAAAGEDKEDIKNRLETADPGFKLLEDLGWAEQHPDANEEAWLQSWNKRGNIKSWISNNLANWRVRRGDDDGAKAKDGEKPSDDQQAGGGEASTAGATIVPQEREWQTGVQREGEQLSRASAQPNDGPSSRPSNAEPHRPVRSRSLSPRPTSKRHDLEKVLPGALPPLVIPSSSSGVASNHRNENDGRSPFPMNTDDERRNTLNASKRATTSMPGGWDPSLDVDHGAEAPGRGATAGDGERLGAAGPSRATEERAGPALTEGSRKGRMRMARERQEWLDWYRKVFLPQERMKDK